MASYHLNPKDVYRYLGYPASPDPETLEQIQSLSEQLENLAKPKAVHKILPVELGKTVKFPGTALELPGRDVALLLKESHHALLMAVTLGQEVDRWLRELSIRDMAKAVIVDSCASSLAEEYCNFAEEEIHKSVRESMGEVHFTDRFSPGYGDLPLDVQPYFCKVLDSTRQIGLSLSQTNIMNPKKSITAVVGIADSPQPMRIRGCGYCGLREHCEYRKGGKICGTSNL